MKKALLVILVAVIAIAAVLVYRAGSVFRDEQLEPATGITEINIDEQLATRRSAAQSTTALSGATAVINFRILPGETAKTVEARVRSLIDDDRVVVTNEYGIDPSPVSPTDSRGFELISKTIRGMDENILVAPYMVRGGTDAKYFYSVSPNVYRFMMIRADPETLKYVHGIDEHVAVKDYLDAIRFYYHLVRQSMSAGDTQ